MAGTGRRSSPAAEVLDRISAVHPVEPVAPARPGEVAQRWRYLDGRGEFGLISSVSTPFCSTCTRARLTAVGELYTCLFAAHGRDLRGLLRGGVDDDALQPRSPLPGARGTTATPSCVA